MAHQDKRNLVITLDTSYLCFRDTLLNLYLQTVSKGLSSGKVSYAFQPVFKEEIKIVGQGIKVWQSHLCFSTAERLAVNRKILFIKYPIFQAGSENRTRIISLEG